MKRTKHCAQAARHSGAGAAVVHLAIALHPGRWAPGRYQQLQRPAGCAQGRANEGQQRLSVTLDAEVLEREVVLAPGMGVVAEREVARVHVHAPKRVAMAMLRIEAVAQQLLARRVVKALPHGGGGFGEGAAEAEQGLEPARGVDPQPGRGRLAGRRRQGGLFGPPQAAITRRQAPVQPTCSSGCRRHGWRAGRACSAACR
jgi:hypothetical protein